MSKFINWLSLVTLAAVLSCLLWATFADAEPDPLIFIDGMITDESITPIKAALQQRLLVPSKQSVDILIDSPGGVVTAGQELINLIALLKGQKRTVNCYTLSMSASMAFYIYSQCTNRWALPGSYLLWHGARIGVSGVLTRESATNWAESLQHDDRLMLYQLYGALRMKADVILHHFNRETLWSGYELNEADPHFLKIVPNYPQLVPRILKSVRLQKSLGMFLNLSGGISCTWSKYLQRPR
jgi:ATP-dependent protease ClpP protease subunit